MATTSPQPGPRTSLTAIFADEEDQLSNPTADDIMDSTEIQHTPTDGEPILARENSDVGGVTGDKDVQIDDDDAGGLFGSGSEDDTAQSAKHRHRRLEDEELDSGDDEGRNDRVEDDMDGSGDETHLNLIEQAATIVDLSLGRHGVPRGSDGELYLLKYPNFLGVDPKAFRLKQFQLPTTDHHSHAPPSTTFSPFQVANSSIRWRHAPNKSKELQSNARILRWSDGSLTMQLASTPTEQYELPAKPLAPPQRNPLKPTPTAINRGHNTNGTSHYDARLDSHTYLASPHEQGPFIRTTNHMTTSLTVQPTIIQEDDALFRLQESLAAAVKGSKTAADGGVGIINISEDPELAKKKAEVAEREKNRAQRRRQNQEEKERDRANRVLGRSGLRTGGMSAGLTVGGLEDDDGMTTSRPRPSKAKKPRRRNSEYSDDEEDYRNRGRTREDEYDVDDGFLVGSDEEPEVGEPDESEEEDELGDDGDEGETRSKKSKGSKKNGDDGAAGGRSKRRRVVDEEEEEDDE